MFGDNSPAPARVYHPELEVQTAERLAPMIDRVRSSHLALCFNGRPGAPRTDAGWRNLIDAIESARDEYSAQRVVWRLKAGKYAPTPADVLGALKTDVRCIQCDDTGWVQKRNSKSACPCVKYGLELRARQDYRNCGGKGFTLHDGVERCDCRIGPA